MVIRRSNTFEKQYQKLSPKVQRQFEIRFKLLISDAYTPQLRLHKVSGNYRNYWSMNVNGDVRALFRYEGEDIIILGFIGTHSQLYG